MRLASDVEICIMTQCNWCIATEGWIDDRIWRNTFLAEYVRFSSGRTKTHRFITFSYCMLWFSYERAHVEHYS